ncbi:MAG: hypothetical protein JXQ90_09810 [Cyclobacteriaceae bacterium]
MKSIIAVGGTALLGKQVVFGQSDSIASNIILNKTKTTQGNVLVVYQSQFGSTAEVAQGVADVIAEGSSTVETKHVSEVTDLSGYDKVVVGSAIQYDHWMPEMRKFVVKHQEELKTKTVAYFFVCLTLSDPSEKAKQAANVYAEKIKQLTPEVNAQSIAGFAGVLDYSKISWPAQIAMRMMMQIFGVKEGDYRDWVAIRTWARKLRF